MKLIDIGLYRPIKGRMAGISLYFSLPLIPLIFLMLSQPQSELLDIWLLKTLLVCRIELETKPTRLNQIFLIEQKQLVKRHFVRREQQLAPFVLIMQKSCKQYCPSTEIEIQNRIHLNHIV